jgi:iron complex outermembrane receptor protein
VTRAGTVAIAVVAPALALALALAGPARAQNPPTAAAAPGAAPALETVVTARPEPAFVPREDRAATASVVIPDDSPRAIDDVGSLLLEVPGVTVTRTGSLGAFSTLTLRGANPDEVRVYVDGVPLGIAAGGAVDLSTLPLGDVERVEVYRGTTPLAFGESALGGVVSITTRTPGTRRALARAGMGSFGAAFGDLAAGGRIGRLRLYAGAHALSATGDYAYNNDMGTPLNPGDDVWGPRGNNDVTQADGVVRAALTLAGRRTLNLSLMGFGREQGLAGPGSKPTAFARFGTTRGIAIARYESRDDLGPGGRLATEIFASEQRDRLSDERDELGLGGPARRRAATATQGAGARASRPFGDWLRSAIVLEGRRETWRPEDELAAIPVGLPARRLVGVGGAEVDVRVPVLDVNVIPSVRAEASSDLVSARDLAGVPVPATPVERVLPVWRLGLVRPLGSVAAIKANVGRYGRIPSFLELYGNGTGRLLGNPGLAPERGINADMALWIDHRGERVVVSSRTVVFGARVDDLIQWQSSAWGQARADNIASARVYGAEQELRIEPGRWFRVVGQLTYLVATDASDNAARRGKQVPFHPRYRGYLRPELLRVGLPGDLTLSLYVDGDLRGQTYADPANLQPFGTRLLLGAGASVAWMQGRLRLTASAANLTGSRIEDFGDWSLPGRSVYFALAYGS